MVGCCQFLSLGFCKHIGLKQSLIGRLCRVIDLMHLSPMPGLVHQPHHWLEEVDIETKQIIDTIEHLQSCSRVIPVIAHQPPHHRPVLLLHMTAIVLLVGTRPGEGNPLPLTVVIEMLVDELTTIVGV